MSCLVTQKWLDFTIYIHTNIIEMLLAATACTYMPATNILNPRLYRILRRRETYRQRLNRGGRQNEVSHVLNSTCRGFHQA
jgi:hypothetical protein